MKLKEIYSCLDQIAPFSIQCEWDNSGLLLGDGNDEINRILVTLDVTEEVVEQAIQAKADLIISHHPLIFESLSQINTDAYHTALILKMARNNIDYIAMHTNMDQTALGEVADELLGIKREKTLTVNITKDGRTYGFGSVGKFIDGNKNEVDITLRDAVIKVKEVFNKDVVKVYGNLDSVISRVAVCTGSGRSMIEDCVREKCDLFVTGDIIYHAGLEAASKGLCVIDAGHYSTEIIFIDIVCAFFKMNIPSLEVMPAFQEEAGVYM